MTLNLPFESLYILQRLEAAGYQAYLVGGAVRDILLKDQDIKDFDFTTDAKPEEIQALFPESFYENDFGTVSITHQDLLAEMQESALSLPQENLFTRAQETELNQTKVQKLIDLKKAKKIHHSLQSHAQEAQELQEEQGEQANPMHRKLLFPPFEITTFRADGAYQDHRRPENVSWGENVADDLSRRDFSINAMAIKIDSTFLQKIFQQSEMLQTSYELVDQDWQLIDQHQGYQDLNNRVIRTVGQADQRFQEDALRMLRAIRFAVQLKMDIETNTYYAIKMHRELMRFVSFERVGDEVMKILASPDPARGIEFLDETGLLEYIMPELKLGKAMQQRGHHISDVWTHSLDALRACPSSDPIVRLAALLHDVGKPPSFQENDQEITFYNHDILGSRIASKIAKRLRLPKKSIDRVFTLVRYHMFHYQPEHSDASIRRFIKRVGLENIDDILDLREGDRLGSGAKKTSWRLEEMKERVIEQLNQPMDLTDLAVDGHDLMKELNIKPGPILGQILNQLLDLVLLDPGLNDRQKLLLEAAKILKSRRTLETDSSK